MFSRIFKYILNIVDALLLVVTLVFALMLTIGGVALFLIGLLASLAFMIPGIDTAGMSLLNLIGFMLFGPSTFGIGASFIISIYLLISMNRSNKLSTEQRTYLSDLFPCRFHQLSRATKGICEVYVDINKENENSVKLGKLLIKTSDHSFTLFIVLCCIGMVVMSANLYFSP